MNQDPSVTDATRFDRTVESEVATSPTADGPAPLFDRLAGLLHHRVQEPLYVVMDHARRLAADARSGHVADTATAILEASDRIADALTEFDAARRAFRRRSDSRPAVGAAANPGSEQSESTTGPAPVRTAPVDVAGSTLARTGLDIRRSGQRVTCSVQLRAPDATVRGEASEIDSATGRGRAAARATLTAAEQALQGSVLALDGLAVVDLFGRRFVAVAVELAHHRHHALLAGIAPLDNSIEDAACFATLDALGRAPA